MKKEVRKERRGVRMKVSVGEKPKTVEKHQTNEAFK